MQPTRDAQGFFDEFVQAFATCSGEVIARRYSSPYLAMRGDGTSDLYSSAQDTARYFQRIVDDYHEQGARRCQYRELDVLTVGRAHLLAAVTWELLDRAGGVVSSWRQSYTLALRDGAYKISASIDH